MSSLAGEDLLRGLAAGNFHDPDGIRAMRIGVARSGALEALREAATAVMRQDPASVVAGAHVTAWTSPVGEVRQWSLFNRHGRTDDPGDDFTYQDLGGKRAHSLFGELVSTLPSLVNLRLNVMAAGASLSPHEEHLPIALPGRRVALRARFHLPLWTNPEAQMLADGDLFHFAEGGVYAFNNGCVHAASAGTGERAHLVWDQLMTGPALAVMFGAEPPWWMVRSLDRLDPVGSAAPEAFEPSRGMSADEFAARTLVPHP